MSELTLLIKTLREQKDKGYNLVQAQVDGLRQSLEIAITTSKEGKAGATKSLGQGDQKQGQQGQQQQQQKKRFSLGRGNQQQQPPKPQ